MNHPQKTLNATEISNTSDEKFPVTVIKMLTLCCRRMGKNSKNFIKQIQHIGKYQTERD